MLISSVAVGDDSSRPKIVASIRPLTLIVADLLGERFMVDTLLNTGVDPHNATLRYSERKRLSEADLLVWLGPDFERFLRQTAEKMPTDRQIRLDLSPDVDWGQPAQSHDHQHHESDGEAGRDVHLWLNPRNAQAVARHVSEAIGKRYPEAKPFLSVRLRAVTDDWEKLDEELATRLRSRQAVPFGVYHNAYGHFIGRYQLNMVASVNQYSERGMSARHLAEFVREMADARCLIAESAGRSAQRLAERIERPMIIADPLAGDAAISSYRELMLDVTEKFERCLDAKS